MTTEKVATVSQGDTLWSIAKREYGNGDKWPILWKANEKAIRATQRDTAKARGQTGPNWIFPGTVLKIPRL